MSLEAKELTLAYGDTIIINDLSIKIPSGAITVLVGANGCGKSTLLRSMARLLKPKQGAVLLDGSAIANKPTKEVAKMLSILPQSPIAPESLSVMDLVKQGRYPYQTWYQGWSSEDEEAVTDALKATGVYELRDRAVDSLSGGQRQRVWIAMTLAQGTEYILLDEPTTFLDLTYQVDILDLLFTLNEEKKRTIVMVLHDLNLAARYAHHMVALKDGKIYDAGPPEEIVTEQLVRDVFGMKCDIAKDPIFGTPLCIPHGKGRVIRRLSAAY